MKIHLLALSLALVTGCSASGTHVQSSADGGPVVDGGSVGTTDDAGGGVGAKSDIPGDPPRSGASVEVTINGVKRTFDGVAAWTQTKFDGGMTPGFQTNAHSQNDWTFVLALFGVAPGTYTCPHGGGLMLTNAMQNDGGFRQDATEYGSYEGTYTCTIQLSSYGSRKGDHVTGTFSGELDLSAGDAPVRHLSLTDGKFDLVQFADTP